MPPPWCGGSGARPRTAWSPGPPSSVSWSPRSSSGSWPGPPTRSSSVAGAVPPTGSGPTSCSRTTRWWPSTRPCSISASSASPFPFAFAIGIARHRPARRGLADRDPALDPVRLGLPHRRDRARRVVVVPGARMGRLLGVGPGRERLVPALVVRHRLPALGDGPTTPRVAAGLEPLVGHRHLQPHHPRHLPHPIRGDPSRSTPSPTPPSGPCSSGSSAGAGGRGGPHRLAGRPPALARGDRRAARAGRGRSWATTCCSSPSPSWCCWGRCSRSSTRPSTASRSRWARRTSTPWPCPSAWPCCS